MIVDELRLYAKEQECAPFYLLENAANEIERLRSILRRCMAGANGLDLGDGETICLYQKDT